MQKLGGSERRMYNNMKIMETLVALLSISISVSVGLKCKSMVDFGVKWTIDCSFMNLSVMPLPNNLHPIVLLNLSHNQFNHLTGSQFINWTDVSHLDLSFNKIHSVDLNTFLGLSNLNELILSNNLIEIVSSNITNHLVKLRTLNLSSNKITFISSGTFEQLPLLVKLYLRHNTDLGNNYSNFKNIIPVLTQGLITLDCSNTSTKVLEKQIFESANHLMSLNFAQNPISDIPILPRNLRHLNLSMTFLETIHQGLFNGSEVLQKITLEGMPVLKAIRAKAFEGMNNLEEFSVANSPKLMSISEDAFGDSSPKLRRVILANCGLTSLSKDLQQIMTKSQWLDLQGNPWICDGRISWIADTDIFLNLTQNLR